MKKEKLQTAPTPVPPKPAPQFATRVKMVEGEEAITSSQGDYLVYLRNAGSNVEIEMRKRTTATGIGFSTGGVTGPQNFQERILEDVERHPEFKKPLLRVLNQVVDQEQGTISLTERDREEIRELLNALT